MNKTLDMKPRIRRRREDSGSRGCKVCSLVRPGRRANVGMKLELDFCQGFESEELKTSGIPGYKMHGNELCVKDAVTFGGHASKIVDR